MKSAGLLRGAYHILDLDDLFLTDSVEASAEAQANYFLSCVTLVPGDLPPMLSIKQHAILPDEQVALCARYWLELVAQRTGVTPVLHASKFSVIQETPYSEWLKAYPVCMTELEENQRLSLPLSASNWFFRQHKITTSSAGTTAVGSTLDCTPEQLRKLGSRVESKGKTVSLSREYPGYTDHRSPR